MPNLGVTADVYESGPMTIYDLRDIEYTIGPAGGFGVLDEAYWDVSIWVLSASFPYPGSLEVSRKWFELDDQGRRTLHYIVSNNTPSPLTVTFCTFRRRLVRIPAR
jgi:hypothetical protein